MHPDETRAYHALLTAGITVCLLTIFYVVMIIRYQQKVITAYLRSIEKETLIAEAERRRMASDYHDELSASLTGIKLKLSTLHSTNTDQQRLLEETNLAVDTVANSIRKTSHQMMSLVLERNGLQAAIEDLLIPLYQCGRYQIYFLWEANGDLLQQEAATQLYRMVQEMLSNIVKHSQADTIEIRVYKERKKLCLFISDNGTGFSISVSSRNQGMGLRNLRARADFLEAKLYLTTGVDKGTCYVLEVPESVVVNGEE